MMKEEHFDLNNLVTPEIDYKKKGDEFYLKIIELIEKLDEED